MPPLPAGKKEEVLRLGMGVLMELMVRRMEGAPAASSPGPRMYLYSGHDSSLMPLLAALGVHVERWPPYLSNLALELWRRPSGQEYVKVRVRVRACVRPQPALPHDSAPHAHARTHPRPRAPPLHCRPPRHRCCTTSASCR